MPMINGFIESQGTKIHYIGRNTQAPRKLSLLFVPGVMMPAWIWEKQIEYFSKYYTVVAMDPRSQGESDHSSEGHYAFSAAKDIKAVVDKLGLQPLVVVGWSIAVPAVINYASYFSAKELKGVVLVDGLAGIDSDVPFYRTMVEYWTQLQNDRMPKTREFIKSIFKQPQTEAYFEKLNKAALRMPTPTVLTLIYNYILQDFRSLLPRLDIPVLFATIEGPRLSYMQQISSLIPNSRLEVFKEAGHALFVDQPDRFNHLLETFIEDLK